MSKKIVLALGGNALGDDLAGQMKAVKITSQAIVDLTRPLKLPQKLKRTRQCCRCLSVLH